MTSVLTVGDVAELLAVCEKTVIDMAKKGELPAFRVRSRFKFRREDVERWIAERCVGTKE